LFSEKVLKQQYLSDAESIAPRDWRQGIGKADQHYDPNLLTFRIPLPEPIDPILLTFPDPMPEPSTEVPVFHEIVVDLPTRIAKIQQAKEYVSIDDTKVQDPALQYPNNYIEESQGMEQPSRMPQFLRLVNFRKHDQIVFEYDSNTREYCKVAVEKWQGGATSGLRCGSYTD
jgi:hypothetical protein